VSSTPWPFIESNAKLLFHGLEDSASGPWHFLLITPHLDLHPGAFVLHRDRLPVTWKPLRPDTSKGYRLRHSASGHPLVFAGQWMLPLVAALISGDVFSSEGSARDPQTILHAGRSAERRCSAGKVAAAAFTHDACGFRRLPASATLSRGRHGRQQPTFVDVWAGGASTVDRARLHAA